MVKQEKEKDPEWSECNSLEEWVEKMLREGYPEIVTAMMKTLPEASRAKYREIWKRVKESEKGLS